MYQTKFPKYYVVRYPPLTFCPSWSVNATHSTSLGSLLYCRRRHCFLVEVVSVAYHKCALAQWHQNTCDTGPDVGSTMSCGIATHESCCSLMHDIPMLHLFATGNNPSTFWLQKKRNELENFLDFFQVKIWTFSARLLCTTRWSLSFWITGLPEAPT